MPVSISNARRKPRLGAKLDKQHPLSRGLVSWWMFNEGGGVKVWDIASKFHGTLTNMDPSTDWVAGPQGIALELDGSNDHIVTGKVTTDLITAAAGTVIATVRPLGSVAGGSVYDGNVIVADDSGYWGLYRTNDSVDRIWSYNYDGSVDQVGVAYTVGEWVTVAWVHAGGNLLIYKNGKPAGTVASGNTTEMGSSVRIGDGYGAAWNGGISDIRIYNRGLDAGEIEEAYDKPYCNILAPQYRRYFIAAAGGGGGGGHPYYYGLSQGLHV